MNRDRILILGGFGYIGSYISKHLQAQKIVQFGNRTQDYNKLTQEYLHQFEYIILLAGHSSVQSCLGPLKSPWLNNVSNFKWLLSNTLPSQKIIYASSSSVYGDKNVTVGVETDISLDYINNYDLTKTTLDLYALQQISAGRNLIGLRFGTVNGASPVIRKDLMINSMVFNALRDKKIFVTNKHVSRPILYIDDLARAINAILNSKIGFVSGIYNLASFNSTVEVMAKEVRLQTEADIEYLPDKPGVYNFTISSSKFALTYHFQFLGTPSKVVSSVIKCYNNEKPEVVIRNEYFEYHG